MRGKKETEGTINLGTSTEKKDYSPMSTSPHSNSSVAALCGIADYTSTPF